MITVIMTTYAPNEERAVLAQRAVRSLTDYLIAPEEVSLHIADDGSPELYTHDLIAYAEALGAFTHVSCTIAPRLGIGGSLNKALRIIDPSLWMYTTDDWMLISALDLEIPSKLILKYHYDYVRLGPIHAGLTGITKFNEDTQYFLELAPSFGGFCFATRPFLAGRKFYQVMGPFPEKLDVYDTERVYADNARNGHVYMAFAGLFDTRLQMSHIGEHVPVGHLKPE